MLFEASNLRHVNQKISLPENKKLSSAIRLGLLSDFHLGSEKSYRVMERAIDMILGQKPDGVVLAGDFLNSKKVNPDRTAQLLKKLTSHVPCYACLGNHDGGVYSQKHFGFSDISVIRDILKRAGVLLIHNENKIINIKDHALQFCAVGDLWNEEADFASAFAQIDSKLPILFLCHNPDGRYETMDHGWDLMLSGHTHGGQICLPLFGAPVAPVKDKSVVEGLHKMPDRQFYITRGVGSVWGIRLFCRPEAVILDIE